jgi:hypothetical protein
MVHIFFWGGGGGGEGELTIHEHGQKLWGVPFLKNFRGGS